MEKKRNWKISCKGYYYLGSYYGTELGVKKFASKHYRGEITLYEDTGKVYVDSGEPVYMSVCRKAGGEWFAINGSPLY